ncbi:MAG: BREX system serine/threonine kinase PglW, partial [Mycobacteriales bacterium]
MDARSPRWVSVTDSEFAHERAGLEHVRALLPDRAPYRAWSNIEFRDSSGKWHEVDLLVLGERRLHLVELKHYQGTITGTAYRWQRNGRSEDSPLLLARRKAQRLKDVIVRAIDDMGGDGRQATPFVQECVFLHAPNGRCNLPPDQRTDLFGLDGATHSGLPSIAARLLERPDANRAAPRLIENNDLAAKLFARIGFAQRREHEVGTWRIIGPPDDEGADWQDWPAEHVKVRSEQVRIRFFVHPEHSPKSDDDARARLVEREYELTHRLRHDGLIVPRDLVVDDLGTGLVFDREPDAARLDLWLADRGRSLTLSERLGLIRQLAEALDYAHRNNVVHRGLTPEAIWISGDPPVLRIADWQLAGRAGEVVTSHPTDGSTTRLFRDMTPSTDLRERQAGGYLAPEDRWAPGIDRVRIDVFGLGAVAYAVLTGRAPGEHTADLQERLRRDNGLDLAADLPEVSPGLRRLVLDATRPKVSDRYAGVAAFRSALDLVEHDAVVVTTVPDDDPLEAVAGTRLDDRFTLVRRLGSGSTAVGMLVTDATAPDRNRVLKVARDDAAVPRLTSEAAALQALPADPQLVRLIEPEPLTVGTRRALLLESAGERTLAEELRDRPRLSLDLQQRWGTDLLRALVALDRAGIDHRDIKPANLGVRERRTGGSNREKHLVLFDFSLARAGVGDTNAGTPPYLDPFLGHGARVRWDSAAERYAASVTLFEMATGQPPQFADDGTAAIMTDDEAHIDDGMFDASVAASLADFFRRALRREAGKRFDTAAEMLSAWSAAFAVEFTRLPEEADAMAAAAALGTPLAASGLSARALSAIEPLRVNTVGDLVAVDPAQLTSLKGSARDTRAEVRTRAKQWRERFATGSGIVGDAQPHEVLLDDVERIARLIVRRCEDRPAPGRTRVIRAVLALGDHDPAGPVDAPAAESRQGSAAAHPAVDPFASLADIAAATGLQGAPTVWLHISKAIELLAGDEESRRVLDAVLAQVEALLAAAGGLLPAAALGAGLVPGVGADRPDAAARRQRIMA